MQTRTLSRRAFLQASLAMTAGTLLAACQPAPAAPTAAPTAAPAEAPTAAAPTAVPPTEGPQQEVTLRWWDFPRGWAPPGTAESPNAWNEEMAKKYSAEHANVKVEVTGVSWSDGPQKLEVALAAGEGPDIMYGYPALFGKMLSLDALEPLDEYLATVDAADLADFFPPAWEFVTVSGRKWAWPWYYGSEGEWAINMTIAQEAKAEDLVPKAPEFGWTPDQMLALAQKCTFQRGSDQVWGLHLYASEQQGINLWPFWSFVYMFGGKLYDEGTAKSEFGNEAGVKAMQFMYDLVEKYKVSPPGTAGLTPTEAGELWNRKQLAIIPSGGVEQMIGVKKGLEAGTIQGPFEVLPVLPPTEQGLPVRTNGGIGVQMTFKQTDASKRMEAIKFGQWLTNSENMKILGNLTPLTARQSTTKALAGDDPVTAWRVKYVLPTMASYSKHPQDMKIDDAWMQALQAMFTGSKTPQEAAKWFQDEANKLLQGA